MNQRLNAFDPVFLGLRLPSGLRMRAYVELELVTLIRRYAEFWAKDVGAEVAVPQQISIYLSIYLFIYSGRAL